jgi:DNA-binding MarR family transcriptional regulator
MAEPRLVLDEFLPFRLSVTSNLVSGLIARAYQSLFALSIPEWRLITVIAESGGITQQAIGARTRMDKVTVSRAAIALVERGLLARRGNPDDRRSHLLELTAAGRDLYAAVAPKALDLEARIFAHFDAEDVAHFTDMLHRIENVAREYDL